MLKPPHFTRIVSLREEWEMGLANVEDAHTSVEMALRDLNGALHALRAIQDECEALIDDLGDTPSDSHTRTQLQAIVDLNIEDVDIEWADIDDAKTADFPDLDLP